MEITEEFVHLSCLSDICHVIEHYTGHCKPLKVARFLLNHLLQGLAEDDFVKIVSQIDNAFPTDALRHVHQRTSERLNALKMIDDDVFAATQLASSHKTGGINLLLGTEKLLQKLQEIHSDSKTQTKITSVISGNAFSQKHVSENAAYSLRQIEQSQVSHNNAFKSLPDELSATDVRVTSMVPPFLKGECISDHSDLKNSPRIAYESIAQKQKGAISSSISIQQDTYRHRKECVGPVVSKQSISAESHISRDSVSNNGFESSHISSIKEQRKALKVYQVRDEFFELIAKEQVLIVIGETGSGKTTQLPQYLEEAGYCNQGKIIGCTQPRRLPTKSIAERVSIEYGCKIGEEVGYSMRFEDRTSRRTRIKYMTDGILLREALLDPVFTKYSVIIIDEAHERNINTDLLLGLLKRALYTKNFKLIVTSATLNIEKFTSFFNNAKAFFIEGRAYPVTISYVNIPLQGEYVYESVKKSMQCHLEEGPGDVLVFLPGKEEIEDAADRIRRWGKMLPADFPGIEVHQIYAALPSEIQSKVFLPAPANTRKIIFSTNVAETSLTIDGVCFVIDPGVFKQSFFHSKTGKEVLGVFPISQAQANQRSGRAGRTAPGKCFRLYTEESYHNEMIHDSVPEIQRSNLANIVLLMKATGVHNVLDFDFIDKPIHSNLIHALHRLYLLGALDSEGLLTSHGRTMAEYPIEPSMSSTLIMSSRLGCIREVATILAVLSVADEIYYRPREHSEEADDRRMKLQRSDGDHMTILSIFDLWEKSEYSKSWCTKNFLNYRALGSAKDIQRELLEMLSKDTNAPSDLLPTQSLSVRVRLSFLSGYFFNAARCTADGYQRIGTSENAYIFPSSAMSGKDAPFVMYHSLIMTSREFMRIVSPIEPHWLSVIAPNYYCEVDETGILKSRENITLEPLFNKNSVPDQWRFSSFYTKRSRKR